MSDYGLLTYAEGNRTYNVGDYVQSLAARQYLPRVDHWVNRERLARFAGPETQIILNGWFTHNVHDWVPSQSLRPLYTSFHVNESAAPHMLTAPAIEHLQRHAPIGCRDRFTSDLLRSHGIDAHFSGCLTLTLDSYRVPDSERGDDIFIVDPLYSYPSVARLTESARLFVHRTMKGEAFGLHRRGQHLRALIEPELLATAKVRTQVLPAGRETDAQKFARAEALLHDYARARLVVTSRIHCALPCLAMGTPVIFLNAFDDFVDSCRFDGLLDLFARVDIDSKTGAFEANFPLAGKIGPDTMVTNPDRYRALVEPMKERCRAFVAGEGA